jgi:hypothetical protein
MLYAHLIMLCFKTIYMFHGNFLKQCSHPISSSSHYIREQKSVTALQCFIGHNICSYLSPYMMEQQSVTALQCFIGHNCSSIVQHSHRIWGTHEIS